MINITNILNELFDREVQSAITFSKHRHKNQIRKFDNTPYFTHPSRVAKLVRYYSRDKELEKAAYLHDTLEDTQTDYSEIELQFGKRVAMLVKELTSVKKELMKVGKSKYLLSKMNKMSSDALIIKLCDRLDNISDFAIAPEKFVIKYTRETLFILNSLNRPLSTKHQDIITVIRTGLAPYESLT